MSDAYTSFWSKERCRQMKEYAWNGETLTVLFGGEHQSEPALRKFGVKEGDYLYPITVSAGVLYLLGRMRVKRLLSVEEYVAENAETFAGYEHAYGSALTFSNWQRGHPEFGYLAPTCTSEVALGEEGTLLGTMIAVPVKVLEGLRFCSQRGERGVKHIIDGRLKSIVSLHGGTYRLSEASAREFASILTGAYEGL